MTNTKFTPGPWRIGPDESSDEDEYGFCIAIFSEEYKNSVALRIREESNAHLIAAAPDLYAALSEAKLQIEYLHEKFAETGSGNNMLAKIDAALAKARGEWSADDILKREG